MGECLVLADRSLPKSTVLDRKHSEIESVVYGNDGGRWTVPVGRMRRRVKNGEETKRLSEAV